LYYGFVTGAMSAGYPWTEHEGSRHETSLGLRGDYCRSRDRHTGFSAAYRSRPLRANWYRSWRQSPRGARPIFSALQSTGRVAWPAWCDIFVGDPNAGDDVPAARRDTPCCLDAITVNAGGDPLGCAGIGNGRATSTAVNPAPAARRQLLAQRGEWAVRSRQGARPPGRCQRNGTLACHAAGVPVGSARTASLWRE
jgi:hypothetical protein